MPILRGHQDDASRFVVPVLLALLVLFVLLELTGAIDVVDGFGAASRMNGGSIPLN